MQGRCHQTTSLPARCANIHIKTLVHKLVDHKLVYHLHFLGNWHLRSLCVYGAEPMRVWCGAYIHDEHIGYVACKKRISLMQEACMFDARSVYV